MKYPDGQTICVGDLVWWNEGSCVGYVQAIAETQEEFESWGLEEPHIFVDNTHPFDPTIGSGAAHDEACLENEAIGLLNPTEIEIFEAAMKEAAQKTVADLNSHQFSVTTECVNGRRVAWCFDVKSGDLVVEKVRVPWRGSD